MKNNSKRRTKVLALALALATVVTSMALFTDRAQASDEQTAGSLDLVLEQTWVADNATTVQSFYLATILYLITSSKMMVLLIQE